MGRSQCLHEVVERFWFEMLWALLCKGFLNVFHGTMERSSNTHTKKQRRNDDMLNRLPFAILFGRLNSTWYMQSTRALMHSPSCLCAWILLFLCDARKCRACGRYYFLFSLFYLSTIMSYFVVLVMMMTMVMIWLFSIGTNLKLATRILTRNPPHLIFNRDFSLFFQIFKFEFVIYFHSDFFFIL